MTDSTPHPDGGSGPGDGHPMDPDDMTNNPMDPPLPPKILPDEHCNARRTRDGEFLGYCKATAGKGTDHLGKGRCKHHGGAGGAPSGEANGNYKHGAFSKHFRRDLTDREKEAIRDMVGDLEEPEKALEQIRIAAAEAAIKYKRSSDIRFLREFRQLLATFNIVPTEQRYEASHTGPAEPEIDVVLKDGES